MENYQSLMKRIEVKVDENEFGEEKVKEKLQVTTSRSVVARNRSAGVMTIIQPIGIHSNRSVGTRLFLQEKHLWEF